MGLPSRDSFYAERDRAVREVALLLQDLAGQDLSDLNELRQLAASELCQALAGHAAANLLLELAATFRAPFPRRWLLDLAAQENLPEVEPALRYLIAQRLLQPDNQASQSNLMMPWPIRAYLYAQLAEQSNSAVLIRRHHQAAQFYQGNHQPIEAAWHFQKSGQPVRAADVLLQSRETWNELDQEALREVLLGLAAPQLSAAQWCEIQILLSDVLRKLCALVST